MALSVRGRSRPAGHCPRNLAQHMTGTKLKWFTFHQRVPTSTSLGPGHLQPLVRPSSEAVRLRHQSPMVQPGRLSVGPAPVILPGPPMGLAGRTDPRVAPLHVGTPIQQQAHLPVARLVGVRGHSPRSGSCFDNGRPAPRRTGPARPPGNPLSRVSSGRSRELGRSRVRRAAAFLLFFGSRRGRSPPPRPRARKSHVKLVQTSEREKALPLQDLRGRTTVSGGLWGNASASGSTTGSRGRGG